MSAATFRLEALHLEARAPSSTVRDAREARSASRDVLAEIARAHRGALYAFAVRLSRDEHEASDLVQDTLERALRRIETYSPETNARAWLFSILHNAFIDRCRRRSSEPKGPRAEEIDLAAEEPSEPPRWTALGADDVAAAVARLAPDFREVYELHAIEGLAYQEIARRLGLPMNTVGTRLARARKKLRALLESQDEEEAT
jgi:RNA polymerase sigma-70 factor (ECF subfamily)